MMRASPLTRGFGTGGLLIFGGFGPFIPGNHGSAALRHSPVFHASDIFGTAVFVGTASLFHRHAAFAASSSLRLGDHVYTVTSYVIDRLVRNVSGVVPTPPSIAVAQEIHLGDGGLIFRAILNDGIPTPIDLSGVTRVDFMFQRPDGTSFTVPTTFATDGTDGMVQYVTGIGDLNMIGTWRHQVRITHGPSVSYSQIVKFKVLTNIGS